MFSRSLFLLLVPVIFAGTLFADDFSIFRIPKHKVFSLTGNVNGSYDHSGTHAYQNSALGTRWTGAVGSDLMWLSDSDPYRSSLTVSAYTNGAIYDNRSTSFSGGNNETETYRDKEKYLREYVNASWDNRYYPWARPVGLTSSFLGQGGYEQHWYKSEYDASDYVSSNGENAWIYNYNVEGSVGIGYGRVRDATSVFTVEVLEDRLRESGAIQGKLSPGTRQKLADLYYTRSDFSAMHQRSDKYFWAEVEKILRDDPALQSSAFNAYSLYRIGESIDGGTFYRSSGFFAGPIFRGSHQHSIMNRTSTSYHTVAEDSAYRYSNYVHSEGHGDLYEAGAQAEYHLAYGPRWQFDGTCSATLPIENTSKAFRISSSFNAEYVIADRWRASFRFAQARDVYKEPNWNSPLVLHAWTVTLGGTLRYFVEDNLSLNLSWTHHQEKQVERYPNIGYAPYNRFGHDTSISIGFSYLFFGAYLPYSYGYFPSSG